MTARDLKGLFEPAGSFEHELGEGYELTLGIRGTRDGDQEYDSTLLDRDPRPRAAAVYRVPRGPI